MMAETYLPAFNAFMEQQDVKGAIDLFQPLGDDMKFDLLMAAFAGEEPFIIDDLAFERNYQELVKIILSRFKNDVTSNKVIYFEKFVFETLLVSPTLFLNFRMRNLLLLNKDTIGSFLRLRESLKSSMISYGLDFYLDAGFAPNQTKDGIRDDITFVSFIEFFEACKENGAADNYILFPSPANIEKLSSSPYIMDYFQFFGTNNMLSKLLEEPVFGMLVSSCSKKSRISARNFLTGKKFESKSRSIFWSFLPFAVFAIIEIFQGIFTIINQKSGLMMTSGILKLCAYMILAIVLFIMESEILSGGYFLLLTISNGMFAISVDTFGSMKWILFAAQLLPIIILLKVSDLPILPFGQIPKESTALERKVRGFENILFKHRSFFKLLYATFLLTSFVSVINIVAVFL